MAQTCKVPLYLCRIIAMPLWHVCTIVLWHACLCQITMALRHVCAKVLHQSWHVCKGVMRTRRLACICAWMLDMCLAADALCGPKYAFTAGLTLVSAIRALPGHVMAIRNSKLH